MNTKGNLDTGHPFHLVDPSPWPLAASIGAFGATSGGVMYFHGYSGGALLNMTGMLTILYCMYTKVRVTWCIIDYSGEYHRLVYDFVRKLI